MFFSRLIPSRLALLRALCSGAAVGAVATLLVLPACFSQAPEGILVADAADTTVLIDLYHKPLPEMPLPNDLATRHDPTSPTGLRINASLLAPTQLESRLRGHFDALDGWGTAQPITIPFSGPLDVQSILEGHRDANYDLAGDVIYLINVDKDSRKYGNVIHLDLGHGNYPAVLERLDQYWKNDARGETLSILFEEVDEDTNGNGILDLGGDLNGDGTIDASEAPEDTDADGVLDVPNYLPGLNPAADDLAGRSDALMTFYEKQTHTLIVRPMIPLQEQTTYAVVITKRLKDANGNPVGSPYPFVNHASQTDALMPLLDVLPAELKKEDIAFAFSFTTQSIEADWIAVRDGLYGHGVQKHLATEFPAEIDSIEPMVDWSTLKAKGYDPQMHKYALTGELWEIAMRKAAVQLLGSAENERAQRVFASMAYVDYFIVGSFLSPQLFDREDSEGNWLPFNDQSWPPDLSLKKAKARSERVYFTLVVPRKENSVRKDGKQAPIVLMGHGYTGNRFGETMVMGGELAKRGLATLAIDAPSHGIPLDDIVKIAIRGQFRELGMNLAADALLSDRAFNQDNDVLGLADSGADFWTSYVFHTRDMLRQYAFDYMQLIRIIRTFDGTKTINFDLDEDGNNELAGDFDGDGILDIGTESTIAMSGGSLGGILAMLMGGIEPEIKAIIPISGGGGLGNAGARTTQGGAREGFVLRLMGTIIAGTLDETSGEMEMDMVVPNMNRTHEIHFATLTDVQPWDTVVVENLTSGERDCAYVRADNLLRTAIATDTDDLLRITHYAGPQLSGDGECGLKADVAPPKRVVDTFEFEGTYQFNTSHEANRYEVGTPLLAVTDGFGLERSDPELRRFMGLGQLVMDRCDPINAAPHLSKDPLYYPGTKQTTGAHAMVISTVGDLAVPVDTSIAYSRAAGMIDYLNNDPRYGKSENQVLIDTYMAESINTYERYTDNNGVGVHIDVDNLSNGTDIWAADGVPRLDPPLRIGSTEEDSLGGGYSTPLFVYSTSTGQHGFDQPGDQSGKWRDRCQAECTETGTDPCGCNAATPWDVGKFGFGLLGRYAASVGAVLQFDECMGTGNCTDDPPMPNKRADYSEFLPQ